MKCLWELFSGYRVSFSVPGKELRCGRRKQPRASVAVCILMCSLTASMGGPEGAFQASGCVVERRGALVIDNWGLNWAPLFKDFVGLVQSINLTDLQALQAGDNKTST